MSTENRIPRRVLRKSPQFLRGTKWKIKVGHQTRDLLEYYAALSGSSVPTFRDNLSVPIIIFFLDFLTLEDGTHRLTRNVGTELPLSAA